MLSIFSIQKDCLVVAFSTRLSPHYSSSSQTKIISSTRNNNYARKTTTVSPLRATWSNGQAIREYQDFLSSGKQEIDMEKDGPSLIVTPSDPESPVQRMVQSLIKLGEDNDIVVTPGSPLPTTLPSTYPIYVVLPPYEVKSFIQTLPDDWKERREDLVFLSGGPIFGCIEPILREFGYARDTMTQWLCSGLWLPPLNAPGKPRDLSCTVGLDSNMEDKLAGECMSCGKWAGAIAERLTRADIRCKTGFYREWRRSMWEQACFDAAFSLIGGVRDIDTTMQDVAKYYESEASDMLWEMTGALRGFLAVTLPYGFEERVFGFAEQKHFAEVPCTLDEDMYEYVFCPPFNGCKTVAEYLNYAKEEKNLLQNTVVPKADGRPSVMRQGNLRADGVL